MYVNLKEKLFAVVKIFIKTPTTQNPFFFTQSQWCDFLSVNQNVPVSSSFSNLPNILKTKKKVSLLDPNASWYVTY